MSSVDAINKRYSNLADKSCCLSCGGAINHADIKESEVAVDIGSGRGNDVLRIAEIVGDNGFVYGIDISDGMLDKARKNAKKFGVKNVEFRQSNIEVLPLETDSVDVLISNCTINHAKDKKAVWSEIFRVLKTGGRFVVSDIYSSAPVPEEFANDPEAIAECWAGATEKEVYMETLYDTGFRDIAILEESDYYPKGKIEVASFTVRGYNL